MLRGVLLELQPLLGSWSSSSTLSMESLSKMYQSHLSLNHLLLKRGFNLHRASLPPPSSSLSSIRASSSQKHHAFHKPPNPLTHLFQTLNPLFSPLVKPTCIAIAATAFFFTRLQVPLLAAAAVPPPGSAASETLPLEEQLCNDADALRFLIETNIRARKLAEAIRVLDRLILLEPDEFEYPLLKAHLHMRSGEHELASNAFEDVLKKDPFHVEAYRGLLMATSETNGPTEELLKRIEEAVRVCDGSDARDFKLLIAQIRVIDGDLSSALKVYEELVKDEPKDFRPYLCQGIVYTMLRNKDEAEKQFQKYRSLAPENHPYKQFFDDNSKILERGGVGAKSSES